MPFNGGGGGGGGGGTTISLTDAEVKAALLRNPDTQVLTDAELADVQAFEPPIDQERTIYVTNAGADANAGRHPDEAVQTITGSTGAFIKVAALPNVSTQGGTVRCDDASAFNELILSASWPTMVDVWMPEAILANIVAIPAGRMARVKACSGTQVQLASGARMKCSVTSPTTTVNLAAGAHTGTRIEIDDALGPIDFTGATGTIICSIFAAVGVTITIPAGLTIDGGIWQGGTRIAGTTTPTNLSNTPAASTVEVESSTGTNTTLPAATQSLAGVLTGADKTKLDALLQPNGNRVIYVSAAGNDSNAGLKPTEPKLTLDAAVTAARAIAAGDGAVVWCQDHSVFTLTGILDFQSAGTPDIGFFGPACTIIATGTNFVQAGQNALFILGHLNGSAVTGVAALAVGDNGHVHILTGWNGPVRVSGGGTHTYLNLGSATQNSNLDIEAEGHIYVDAYVQAGTVTVTSLNGNNPVEIVGPGIWQDDADGRARKLYGIEVRDRFVQVLPALTAVTGTTTLEEITSLTSTIEVDGTYLVEAMVSAIPGATSADLAWQFVRVRDATVTNIDMWGGAVGSPSGISLIQANNPQTWLVFSGEFTSGILVGEISLQDGDEVQLRASNNNGGRSVNLIPFTYIKLTREEV